MREMILTNTMTVDTASFDTAAALAERQTVILVLSTDADRLRLIRDVLGNPTRWSEPAGCVEIRDAESLDAGIAQVRGKQVDCVILCDGLEAGDVFSQAAALRDADPSLPFILITDETNLEWQVSTILHGAHDVLTSQRMSSSSLWRAVTMAMVRRERNRQRDEEENRLQVVPDAVDGHGKAADTPVGDGFGGPVMDPPAQEQTGPRILVADDDAAIHHQIYDVILSKCGVSYDIVASGEDAIAMAQQFSYSLILLDIQMPGLDGVETMQELRRNGCVDEGTSIVAVTSHTGPDVRRHYLEAGMDDYLAKPLTPQSLINLIGRHLPAAAL